MKVPTSTAGTPAETAKPGAPSSSHDVKTTYDVTATYNVTATHVPPMTSSRQAGVNPTATTTGKDAVSSTPTAQQSTGEYLCTIDSGQTGKGGIVINIQEQGS